MTKQVKVFLVFLAVLAVFSVLSFFDIFTGVKSAKLHDFAIPLLPIEQDADQDGLSNKDESYWNTDFQNPDTDGDGFLDGEEVVSGFDPRVPSDHSMGDNIESTVYGAPKNLADTISIDENLSENALAAMIAGVAAGDLRPDVNDDAFDKGVEAISLTTFDNFSKMQSPPETTYNVIEPSKENQLAYLNSLADIIKKDLLGFSQVLNTSAPINGQFQFFAAKSEQFKIAHSKITSINVPRNWLEIHKAISNAIYGLYLNYHFIGNYENDVLKATIALGQLSSINAEITGLLKTVQAKILEEKLEIDDSLYRVMDLIYKQ